MQYGCGLVAPPEWTNFDASPTLKIQKMPLIGVVMKRQLNTVFPRNVLCGDIVKGLPVNENSCDGLYCSHVLEHLSLNDFRKALTNSYRILKKGGIFRLVVPDLEIEARSYIRELDRNNPSSSVKFIGSTLIGTVERPRGIRGITEHIFGNSRHLWMWDTQSITHELQNTGFTGIRNCMFGDCTDKMFEKVENADRFNFCVAIECTK